MLGTCPILLNHHNIKYHATYGQGSEYAGKAINSPRVAKATTGLELP